MPSPQGSQPLTPASHRWAERVRESFERQAFMATLGAELVGVEPGAVEVVLAYRRALTQQHGYLHAGVASALADTACGYAAFTLATDDQTVLTVEYKINLVAPGEGARFRARAQVVAAGRRLKTVVATVHGERDGAAPLLVAQAQATILTPQGADR